MQNYAIRKSSQVDVCCRFQETRIVRISDEKFERSCNSQSKSKPSVAEQNFSAQISIMINDGN